jgi:hypothetical protein
MGVFRVVHMKLGRLFLEEDGGHLHTSFFGL